MSQTPDGRSVKLFEEMAYRIMACAAYQLGRLDEFAKLQETMEQRGTNKVNDRSIASWYVTVCVSVCPCVCCVCVFVGAAAYAVC